MPYRRILGAVVLVLLIGTLGYHHLEGWSLMDGFYMTAITITTVGFGEVHPLSDVGRLFTLFILFIGVGVGAVAVTALASAFMKGEIRKALGRGFMNSAIKKMKGHYIIAGYGRMGRVIAEQLKFKRIDFVVIDTQTESITELEGDSSKIPFVLGNATIEDTLLQAGIDRARGFISVLTNDADNAFAIMIAKSLNPTLRVVTRATSHHTLAVLQRAGAHKVINPYMIGGNRIAQAMINPSVVDFVEILEDTNIPDIEMAEVIAQPGSRLISIPLEHDSIKALDVMIVGIKSEKGDFCFRPKAHTKIHDNDRLIIVGPANRVQELTRLAQANS